MLSKDTIAKKAARTIRNELRCTLLPSQVGVITVVEYLTKQVQAAIEEAGTEQQERIDALMEALREAQTCLIMEGYGSSKGRRHHIVMDLIQAALAPFKPLKPKESSDNAGK